MILVNMKGDIDEYEGGCGGDFYVLNGEKPLEYS